MTTRAAPVGWRDGEQDGFALLMVLLFLLAVTAIIAPLVLGARTEFLVSSNKLQQDRLESIADGIVTVLARQLAASPLEPRNETIKVNSTPMRCQNARYVIEARVQDQAGLIGINNAPVDLLTAGFTALQFPASTSRDMAEATVAFRTKPAAANEPGLAPMQAPAAGRSDLIAGGMKLKPFEAVEELYDYTGFKGKPVQAINEVFSLHNTTENIIGPKISTRLARILPSAPTPRYPFVLEQAPEGAKTYRIDIVVKAANAPMTGYSGAIVAASENENGDFEIVERTGNPEFQAEGPSDFAGAVDCDMLLGEGVEAALLSNVE
jgi:general secretion pathway protein K